MGIADCKPLQKPVTVYITPSIGVMTPLNAMITIRAMKKDQKGSYGCDGLDIESRPNYYQDKLFQSWNDGSGLGKLVLTPYLVIRGEIYPSPSAWAGQGQDFANYLCTTNLYKFFRGTDIKPNRFPDYSQWVGTCTPGRNQQGDVIFATPSRNGVASEYVNGPKSNSFACIALR